MRALISHLRHTIRLLLKSPGFTITAILILGLGIGANTAIFSLINGILLKPLPYPQGDRLVRIYQPTQDVPHMNVAYSDYKDFRAGQHSLKDLTLIGADDFQITGDAEPERLDGAYVTGNFFALMGRPLLLGRPFGEKEEKTAAHVAVLTDVLWRKRFHGDPKVIGRNITLNGRSFEIIGVTPQQANEIERIDLYVPFTLDPRYKDVSSRRSGHMFDCIGRLKDGITLVQAQADFEVINQNLVTQYPDTSAPFGINLVPLLNSVVSDYATTLWLLGGAVLCLLLITCANTANLLLARARERTKELTVRAALGASRERLIVQLLSECLILAVLGGGAGLLTACWGVSLIKVLDPGKITRLQTIAIDGRALLFVFGLTLLTALLFGLLPALVLSRTNLASTLRDEGGRTGTAGRERQRSQSILVIGQVALASVLLIAAGLLLRSFLVLQSVPLGFNSHNILTADVYLADSKYADEDKSATEKHYPAGEKRKAFFDALLNKVSHLPGVIDAGISDGVPFGETSDHETLIVAGQPVRDVSRLPWMIHQIVSPGYFRALGIHLLKGRFFDDRDQENAENVVIINERIAQRFFGDQDPIGKHLDDAGQIVNRPRHLTTIVGVVANVQHNDPEIQQTPFQAYFPYTQSAGGFGEFSWFETLALHTNADPRSLFPALRKTVDTIDPDLPLTNVGAYDDLIAKSFTTKRLSLIIVSLFSGVALLLASIGLYAVLSYSVSLRVREIGVRMALGAEAANILKLVTYQGLRIIGVGLIIGIGGGIILGQIIGSVLYGISATDPTALLTGTSVLALAALLACLLPAFRATRIDPITALRE
jgi:putative ABC transport system permease protein